MNCSLEQAESGSEELLRSNEDGKHPGDIIKRIGPRSDGSFNRQIGVRSYVEDGTIATDSVGLRRTAQATEEEHHPDSYLEFPVSTQYKTAPVEVLRERLPSQHGSNVKGSGLFRLSNVTNTTPAESQVSTDYVDRDSHASRSAATQPPEAPLSDDEDVWEDEDEGTSLDENGQIIYGRPNFEDVASDDSNEDEDDQVNLDRRTYREATKQYKRSRRALLLSGLSSIASSPSDDNMDFTSAEVQLLGSGGSDESFFEPAKNEYHTDSYLSARSAEPIDSMDIGTRDLDTAYISPSPTGQLCDQSVIVSESDVFVDPGSAEAPVWGQHDESRTRTDSARSKPEMARATSFQSDHQVRPQATPRLSVIRLNSAELSKPANGKDHGNEKGHGLMADPVAAIKNEDDADGDYQLAPPFDSSFDGLDTKQPFSNPRTKLANLSEDPSEDSRHGTKSLDEVSRDNRSELPKTVTEKKLSEALNQAPFSLWDYLQEEVLATDFDATQEMKWERVTNFISIPFWMEKIILFGFIVCLDSFLYTFTILPLRFGVAAWRWLSNTATWMCGGEKRYLQSSHKCDILKMLLIVLSCVILSRITDASKMYHSVRGQDVVKLSVIFNVLEIADRLCCSFGQDLLDSLFSRSTLARRKNGRQPYLRPLGFFALSLCYVLAHTLVLFYQLVTLNVAINSYDNALLTLLLSNQFVEIKSSVFKKFEKENVFQMTCADIVERFQLTLMLSAIGLRNLIELSGGSLEGGASPLPASFTVFPSLSLLETILTPVLIVLASECIVDWLKHAFITKFNHIRPAVYGRFMDVLCRDLVVGGPSTPERTRKHTFVDQSPIVSRRLGFAALPLACLLVRLILQILGMIGDTSHIDECAIPLAHTVSETGWVGTVARKFGAVDINNEWIRAVDLFVRGSAWALITVIAWVFLVAVKLLLGTNLIGFAARRYATMHEREAEENLNSRDRSPIGTNKEERSYDKGLGRFINKAEDDAVQIMLDGTHVSTAPASSKEHEKGDPQKPKKDSSLINVSRYTMVRSRIW